MKKSIILIIFCFCCVNIFGEPVESENLCHIENEALQEGKSRFNCTLKVNPKLYDFDLKISISKNDLDEQYLEKIEVHSGQDNKLIQTLEGELIDFLPNTIHYLPFMIRGLDVNLDGHTDLVIRTPPVKSGSDNDTVWVFNEKNNKFKYLKSFGTIQIDKKARYLLSLDSGYTEKYIISNKNLTLFERRKTNFFLNDGEYDLTTIERSQNGKMEEVGKEYWLNEEGPTTAKFRKELILKHKEALRLYRKKKLKGALSVFRPFFAMVALDSMDALSYKNKDSVLSALNDYGFFLDEAGQHEEAILVLNKVKSIDNNRIVVYLNLADALYKLNQKKKIKV